MDFVYDYCKHRLEQLKPEEAGKAYELQVLVEDCCREIEEAADEWVQIFAIEGEPAVSIAYGVARFSEFEAEDAGTDTSGDEGMEDQTEDEHEKDPIEQGITASGAFAHGSDGGADV